MTQVVEGVRSAPPDRSADRLGRRTYVLSVAVVLGLALAFRIAFGARGTFTGDDWTFRESMAQPFSLARLFEGHNGHLNPIGLFLQWALQQAFPGRYVPLMITSALLVVASAAVAAWWFAMVFGRRWTGIAVALITALSPMLLELMTWWSVALYAAPMVLAAWLTVVLTTRYASGRGSAVWVLVAYAGCLLSSSKALLLPLILLGLVAGLALGSTAPAGFRRGLRAHWRLWLGIIAVSAGYAVLFGFRRGETVTASPTVAQLWEFVVGLWRAAFLPAIWGGPWSWFPLGFHNAPVAPPLVAGLTAAATLAMVATLLIARPRTWRILLMGLAYIVGSMALVAVGRAGSMWGGATLRYTFDLLLPVVLIVTSGLFVTRWETNGRSVVGERWAAWRGWPITGIAALAAWIVALSMSMQQPWQSLPDNPMKQWIANVRTAYPYVSQGLLLQPAPWPVSTFAEDLDRFLAGDPDKPPTVMWVPDRAMGFDEQGRLIDKSVQGVPAHPPLAACSYEATKLAPAHVPLQGQMPAGRHTLALDYTLGVDSAVTVQLGQSPATTMRLPSGTRRAYAVVEGPGDHLVLAVSEPNARLCVTGAVVGTLVDGPPVDLATLPAPVATQGAE